MSEDSKHDSDESDESPSTHPKPDEKPEASRGPRVPRGLFLILSLGVALLLILSYATDPGPSAKITLYEFQQHWDEKEQRYVGFEKAVLNDDKLDLWPLSEGGSNDGAEGSQEEKSAAKPKLWVKIPPSAIDSDLLRDLETIPKFEYDPSNQLLLALLYNVLWLLPFVLIFYFLVLRPLRSQGGPGSLLSFGRSRPRLIAKDHSNVRFDDVAGIQEAKEEVAEVIEFLKYPEKFQKIGGRIPRGLLFVGPPGTGKTLLAKAIAGEADVPFYSISGSDFVEMFVGVGASRVRDLFRQAKENTPCIIFLDEVDAVGRRRGSGLGGGHDEREQTLNAILVEMDGFETNDQVIVIAATNRPDVLDPALLRPGRFDREIIISLPDVKGRLKILKVHIRHIKLSDQVDLMRIARGTPMFSGADLEALINEAAIRATMAGKDHVDQEELEEARDKVRFGRQQRSRVLDDHDREVTAYHEAGHAIVTLHTSDVEPLHKVTIIPRGMALGATMMLPEKDRYTIGRKNLLGEIKILFGGRIAEQIFCDDISSGAASDIDRASDIARKMVCDFGMSEDLGPVRYSNKEQHVFLGGETVQPREFSDATAEKIDIAVREIIDQCYREANRTLREHSAETEFVAKALLKHETLSVEEIEQILEAKDIDVVSKAEKGSGTDDQTEADEKEPPEPALEPLDREDEDTVAPELQDVAETEG